MKTKFFFKICLVVIYLLVSFSLFAQQSTFYVSTTGSDDTGDGSIGNPYQSVQFALNQTSDNDTVILRGGNYPSAEIRIDNNNITIKSYAGEWAIIEAPVDNEDIGACLWYHNPEIQGGRLERLEIIGGYYYGIKFESNWNWGIPYNERRGVSNVTVINCKIHDTGRDCIKITPGSDNLLFESCEIYNSGVGPANVGDPNAEGIDCVNADNLTVRNCYIHNTSTTGVYSKGGSINSLIENNLVMNTGENGILLGFYTDQEWFDTIVNPNYYENLNSVVRNNYVINTVADGIGMYAAFQPKIYNNTVINAANEMHAALFINTGYIWIDELQDMIAPPCVDIFVANNIFSVNKTSDMPVAQIRYYEDDIESNMVGNCIIDYNLYFKQGRASFNDGIDWQNLTFAQWKASTNKDANSMENNPDFDANFHLNPTSPCVDMAYNITDLKYDYDGNLRDIPFDIGADEYNAGSNLSIPPVNDVIGTGNGVTGISNEILSIEDIIKCFPNPVFNEFFIELNPQNNAFIYISLYDITGKLVKNIFSGNVKDTKQLFKVNTDGLKTGIYSVSVILNGKKQSKNIIIIE